MRLSIEILATTEVRTTWARMRAPRFPLTSCMKGPPTLGFSLQAGEGKQGRQYLGGEDCVLLTCWGLLD